MTLLIVGDLSRCSPLDNGVIKMGLVLTKEAIGLVKAVAVRNARMAQAEKAEKLFEAELRSPLHSRAKFLEAKRIRDKSINKARGLKNLVANRVNRKVGSALKMFGLSAA